MRTGHVDREFDPPGNLLKVAKYLQAPRMEEKACEVLVSRLTLVNAVSLINRSLSCMTSSSNAKPHLTRSIEFIVQNLVSIIMNSSKGEEEIFVNELIESLFEIESEKVLLDIFS